MYNNRNNGYPFYQQASSSMMNQQSSGFGETEWSTRDETWRGSNPGPAPMNDSWKPRESTSREEFQFGRDRAPANIDDQFLLSIKAKRLNNGNLVDRNGYTLRTRDPYCQAPSPPAYNPGRELRKAERTTIGTKVDQLSQNELEEKAQMQIEMMRNQGKRDNRQNQRLGTDGNQKYEEYAEHGPAKVSRKMDRPLENSIPHTKFPQTQPDFVDNYQKRVHAMEKPQYLNLKSQEPSATVQRQPGFFFQSVPSVTPSHQQLPPMNIPPPVPVFNGYQKPKRAPLLPDPPGVRKFPPPNPVNNNPFGINNTAPAQIQNSEVSSDSEDEAIAKLRAVVQNYGKH